MDGAAAFAMKILLVQTSFLGDTILSTPVIGGIRKLYPDCELWMLTTPTNAELVIRDTGLAGVLTFDKRGHDRGLKGLFKVGRRLRNMHFDKVYALQRSFRTALLLFLARIPERIGFQEAKGAFLYHRTVARKIYDHDVLRNLAILTSETEIETLNKSLSLSTLSDDELSPLIKERLSGIGRYAVIVPGSAWKTKMWKWQGYCEVARYLRKQAWPVILLGNAKEMEIAQHIAEEVDVIDLSGRSSLSEMMYIVKHAKLVICNDSMTLHLASTFKVPTVAIFCATSPEFGFGPWENRAVVVQKEGLGCKPCQRHGGNRCPTGTESCIRELSALKVIEAINGLVSF